MEPWRAIIVRLWASSKRLAAPTSAAHLRPAAAHRATTANRTASPEGAQHPILSMAASFGERAVLSMIASRPPAAAALKGRH
jgi:hypothetical protein